MSAGEQQKLYIDPETEEQLIAGVVQNNPVVMGSGIYEELEDWHFSIPDYQWLIRDLRAEGRVLPKPLLIEKIHQTFQKVDDRDRALMVLTRLYDLPLTFPEDAASSFRKFLAFQTATAAVRKFFEKYQTTKNVELSIRDLTEGLSKSAYLVEKKNTAVFDYAAGWEQREADRKHLRDNPDLSPRLRLGIARFDAQVKMKVGTVTNFLAPMKRYKSVMLTSAAYAGILQGFNVFLAVLENTPELTMNRLDSMFTQINYDRIVNYLKSPSEKKFADDLFRRIDSWPQRLKIIKGEPKRTGVVELDRELKSLSRDGFVAELGVYDYANLMKPSVGQSDDHLGQTQVIWDMQNSAKQNNRIIVTASQANVAGAGVDKDGKPIKLREDMQGKALGISQAVDNSIAINIELGQVDEHGRANPAQIILSILFMRDGKITEPDIRLLSEVDRMCLDRGMRELWSEAQEFDGVTMTLPS